MPVNKKMTNDQIDAEIRRTVDRMAYELLLDCEPPAKEYDWDSYYNEEHWEIDLDDLFIAIDQRLADNGWEWEEGDGIGRQIEFLCRLFLDSWRYGEMVGQIRRGYYEGKKKAGPTTDPAIQKQTALNSD